MLRPGAFADLVLFDQATVEAPVISSPPYETRSRTEPEVLAVVMFCEAGSIVMIGETVTVHFFV